MTLIVYLSICVLLFAAIVAYHSISIQHPPYAPTSSINSDTEEDYLPSGHEWTYIGTKGGVETYLRKVEGSNLLAFRGVAVIDLHISEAMGPYINLTLARDWVSMLKYIHQYPVIVEDGEESENEDIVHQVNFVLEVVHTDAIHMLKSNPV